MDVLIPGLLVDLGHCHAVSSLCTLYKFCHNPKHALTSELPDFFQEAHIARFALSANILAFTAVRLIHEQYKRILIPATTDGQADATENITFLLWR